MSFWRESNGIVVGPNGVYNCEKCPCDPGGSLPYCTTNVSAEDFSDDFERTGALGSSDGWTAGTTERWQLVSNGANTACLPYTGSPTNSPLFRAPSTPSVTHTFDLNLHQSINVSLDLIDDSGYTPAPANAPFFPARHIGLAIWNFDNRATAPYPTGPLGAGIWWNGFLEQFECIAPGETAVTVLAGSLSLPDTLEIDATLDSYTDIGGFPPQNEYVFDFLFKINGSTARTATGITFNAGRFFFCVAEYAMAFQETTVTPTQDLILTDNFAIDVTPVT